MVHLRAGTASLEDVDDIVALSETVFAGASMTAWRPHHVRSHIERFRSGQMIVRLAGDLVASSTAMLVSSADAAEDHTWMSITSGSTLANHDPEGEVLYGLEIVVHPDHRGRGISRLLYDARKVLVESTDLTGLVVVGRIPGFADAHAEEGCSVDRYVREVVSGKRSDPVLSKQLAVGLEPAGILENYVVDPASRHHGVRLRWSP